MADQATKWQAPGKDHDGHPADEGRGVTDDVAEAIQLTLPELQAFMRGHAIGERGDGGIAAEAFIEPDGIDDGRHLPREG